MQILIIPYKLLIMQKMELRNIELQQLKKDDKLGQKPEDFTAFKVLFSYNVYMYIIVSCIEYVYKNIRNVTKA